MHRAVLQSWKVFSEPLEGRVASMYLDVIGLVTTGVGNLIDASRSGGPHPWTPALSLPFKHADGTPAPHAEIRDAWLALKARPELAKMHWKYAAKLNDLRLSDGDIDALVERKLLGNERELRKAFPAWDQWPADAQLGALSMSWAVGTGFPGIFKNFTKYANASDWIAASVACKIKTTAKDAQGRDVPNPGTIPRNRANELCFWNAATVVEHDLARDVLWWPQAARRESATEPAPPTPDVTGLAAETARRLYEETEAERRAARDASIRELDEDARVTLPDSERKA